MPHACDSSLFHQRYLDKTKSLEELGYMPLSFRVIPRQEMIRAKNEWQQDAQFHVSQEQLNTQLDNISKKIKEHSRDGYSAAEAAARTLHETLVLYVQDFFTALHEHAKHSWQDLDALLTMQLNIHQLRHDKQKLSQAISIAAKQKDTSDPIFVADMAGIKVQTTQHQNNLSVMKDELNAMNQQLSDLIEQKRQLIQDNLSREQTLRDPFKQQFSHAIDTAREVLEKHRGWGGLFKTLILLLSGIGTLPALVNLGYRAATGHYLFFKNSDAPLLNRLNVGLSEYDSECVKALKSACPIV